MPIAAVEMTGFAGATAASMVIVLFVQLALRIIFMEAVIAIHVSQEYTAKFLIEL